MAGLWTVGDPLCATAQEDEVEPAAEQTVAPEPIPREHHRWARFRVGAWREVRIVDETLDAEQQVTGRSEIVRMERLKEVGPKQFTLEQQVDIEVGGERVQSPPMTVTLGIATDEPGSVQSFTQSPPESVSLDGRDVEARVLTVETGGEAYTVRTRLLYSPVEPPYLLRSISEAVVPASEETVWRRTKKVLARELPFQWRDRQFAATFWEEQHVSTKGTKHSILVSVPGIPGGVVTRWTKETNLESRLIRREIQTLLDWGLGADVAAD